MTAWSTSSLFSSAPGLAGFFALPVAAPPLPPCLDIGLLLWLPLLLMLFLLLLLLLLSSRVNGFVGWVCGTEFNAECKKRPGSFGSGPSRIASV